MVSERRNETTHFPFHAVDLGPPVVPSSHSIKAVTNDSRTTTKREKHEGLSSRVTVHLMTKR